MAVIADLISRVRRRVHDSGRTPPLYADVYYEESLDRGIRRINLDLGTTYTIASLPDRLAYMLSLRGTIEMCYIRGAEGATSDVADLPSSQYAEVTVPNLAVVKSSTTTQGPEYWLKLAQLLEDEYERLLETEEEEEPEPGIERRGDLELGFRQRRSLRTGRMSIYNMDQPLPAREIAIALEGTTVVITWNVLYHHDLVYYLIERSINADMSDSEEVGRINDNHTVTSSDDPGSGEWFYRVVVVNANNLRTDSQIVSVTVA
jgi:hypothetical protein